IMVGTGRGARMGVLIRNATALEEAGRMTMLIVDKTGTLTEGKPEVTEVTPLNGANRADVLRAAASLEQGSTHPLAKAISAAARTEAVRVQAVSDFVSAPGRGVRGRIVAAESASLRDRPDAAQDVMLGSLDYLAENGVAVPHAPTASLQRPASTVVGIAVD